MQSVIKEMEVWIVFLDFRILGGGLRLRPRVFTVLIYPALFDQMLRAAMVVLNKFRPKETLPIIVALSPLGKSTKTSSLRTQGASVAYTEQPTTKKARHRRNSRARKKLKKTAFCSDQSPIHTRDRKQNYSV